MNNAFTKIALSLLATAAAITARADDNLLTNPGFETGNFTGWTVSGPFIGIQGGGHLSTFSAYAGAGFGDNGAVGDRFSQTITTTPGLNYDVTLWVNGSHGDNGDNYVLWNGATVLNAPNPDYSDWTQLTVRVPATTTSTTVTFGFYSGNSYFFDDASVALATPEPTTLALGALGLTTLLAHRRCK